MATNDSKTAETPAAEAPAVAAPVEAPKAERKGKQLGATVTPEFYAEFSDLQWDLRKPVTDLVRQAVEEFAAKHKKA